MRECENVREIITLRQWQILRLPRLWHRLKARLAEGRKIAIAREREREKCRRREETRQRERETERHVDAQAHTYRHR